MTEKEFLEAEARSMTCNDMSIADLIEFTLQEPDTERFWGLCGSVAAAVDREDFGEYFMAFGLYTTEKDGETKAKELLNKLKGELANVPRCSSETKTDSRGA